MNYINKYIVFFIIILMISCTIPKSSEIPFIKNSNIKIDGIFDDKNWKISKTISITSKHSFHLIEDSKYLFIGIKSNENTSRYVDLYLSNNELGMINLHASAKLCERKLEGNWVNNTPSWNWGNNNGWEVNTVVFSSDDRSIPFSKRVISYEGYEFKISKEKINLDKLWVRFDVEDFMGDFERISFPSNSNYAKVENWFLITMKTKK
jgi:hypothetical protein